jgi:xylan 1,4-beta-xylosidase
MSPVRPRPRALTQALVLVALLTACVLPGAARAQLPVFGNPVIAGDHPDPTIMRDGGAFYASATSASWAPIFPIFRSPDLVNWRQVGAVLPRAPAWATGSFWAPELVRWGRRVFAFYSAARRGGRPCIGVATAPRPEGPWADGGQALCLPGGTIDPAPVTDSRGSRWLVYKRMGTGSGIWAVRFSTRRLRAVGHRTKLIEPDAGWEGGVTEGPALVHRPDGWFLFYAGGHCCRPPCTYAESVARAPALLGPYVKAPQRLLRGDSAWKCPGHGTLVDLGPRGIFLLHHAYRAGDTLDERRSVLLDPVVFGADGWPAIGQGGQPAASAPSPLGATQTPVPGLFADRFAGSALLPGWEWPFDRAPQTRVTAGGLDLTCLSSQAAPAFVARQVPEDRYAASATLDLRALRGSAAVGLMAHGPGRVLRGVELRSGRLRAVRIDDQGVTVGPPLSPPGALRRDASLTLLIGVAPDGSLATYASSGRGAPVVVPPGPAASGPSPTRIALTCRGTGAARFSSIRVRATPAPGDS